MARAMMYCIPAANVSTEVPAATNVAPAVPVAGSSNDDVSEQDQNFDLADHDVPAPTAAAAAAVTPPFNIRHLLQRPKKPDQRHIVVSLATESLTTCNTGNTYKLHETQAAYEEYCALIRSLYCDEFWKIFASVYREKAVIIDRVLKSCKDTFVAGKAMKKRFEVRIGVFIYGCSYMCVHIWVFIYGVSYMIVNAG